ncbi:MAG: hypothetical protein BRC29_00900 [Nanohaloarchaea archaeon SW_7_43_1]|nr:MAG: hypothetical protein BRC29_00900 [Nanohaloarchaea archaeon SW_7_43_1]
MDQTERACSSYLLKYNDKSVLVDTGMGMANNLPRIEESHQDINAIINTHRHPDHISDLIPFIQNKLVENIYYSKNEEYITLYGPEGHSEYVESRIAYEMDESVESLNENNSFEIKVVEFSEGSVNDYPDLECIEADHGGSEFPCYSLKFETDNYSIVFTGDTDFHDRLVDFCDGADLVVADCSMPDNSKVEGHMTPSECAQLSSSANVDKLVLSHLYPEVDNIDLRSRVKADFEGEVVVAEDLKEISS